MVRTLTPTLALTLILTNLAQVLDELRTKENDFRHNVVVRKEAVRVSKLYIWLQ